MTEPTYLVLAQDGMVTNVVIGFVDLSDVGLIEQTDDLADVGIFWIYDAEANEFVSPDSAPRAEMILIEPEQDPAP